MTWNMVAPSFFGVWSPVDGLPQSKSEKRLYTTVGLPLAKLISGLSWDVPHRDPFDFPVENTYFEG
jgi:hypothetical protein